MPNFKNLAVRKPVIFGAAVIFAVLVSVIIESASSAAKASPPPPAPQAVPVSVQTVQPRHVKVWSEFSGRMKAVDYAEIRPEVSGRITSINFKDGQMVEAGDVLFVIDPRSFEAAVAKAEANLASANTNAVFAKTEVGRAAKLVKSQAIAQRLYDERATSNRVAQDTIKSAEAELKQAKVDLDHAYVKAPISGRISRAEITVGNLVQAGPGAPLLTSIVSNDGIYADFEVDEQTYLKSFRAQTATQAQAQEIPVIVTAPGDDAHPHRGTIYSFDNKIDTGTGTIRARARFDNEDSSLVPGMFVSVSLASNNDADALLVPERAIGSDQNKKFVYVVGQDNKVAYREITLGQRAEGQRIVLTGLQPGERVIVDGIQHVHPDAVVQPKEVPPDAVFTPAAESTSEKPSEKIADK